MSTNTEYSIIKFPIDIDQELHAYNAKEITDYGKWFMEIKEERLNYLCQKLFKNPDDCLKEENIAVLELFLQHNISAYKVSEEEMQKLWATIPEHFKPAVKLSEYGFDEHTLSICFDLGLFLGELLISLDKEHNIKWQQEKDKKFYFYGQVVLVTPLCKGDLDPYISAKNCASKILHKEYEEGEMQRMFSYWKEMFKIE